MFNIDLTYEPDTAEVTVQMPYAALLTMFSVVTDRICPEDLTNPDSIGEAVLTEFVKNLFGFNEQLLNEQDQREAEDAIAEAENIIKGEVEE